ncbi:hypothetical protein P8452_07480 [Trifolium repens]|nr:hypothetical protein P8452_07480 [Trifolium repens]
MAGNFNLLIRQSVPLIGRVVRMAREVDWSGKVIKQVEREKNNLISNRDIVRRKLDATDHKTEKVNDVVFDWLKKSDILIQEVENLNIQAKSPLWNDFSELLEKITEMNEKCEFEPFSTPIPSLEHFSSGNIVCFNSREKTSDQLLMALKDDSCSVIGLYEDVGIPSNSKRCKVLLTACSREDCDLLYSQKDIQLGPLSPEESWTLFQKHSGIHSEEYSSSFDLLNLAREVASECEGLPETIKDVGSSLRSKPIEEWKTTLDMEPSDIRHMRNSYGKYMAQHENTFGINSERVQKWKSALVEVCSLSGKAYTTGYECDFINNIVEDANGIKSRLQIRST